VQVKFVLMESPAEKVAPPDLSGASRGRGWRSESAAAIWWSELETSVWPLLVEVPDADVGDMLELAATEDQEPIEALSTHAADPAFRVGVGVRRADDRDVFALEDAVEGTAELRVAIVDQEARPSSTISRLRACWAIHVALGLLVQARYSTLGVGD